MDIGKAMGIFRNLSSGEYSTQEKWTAIYIVANMETHNSVTRGQLVEALKFICNLVIGPEELVGYQYKEDET